MNKIFKNNPELKEFYQTCDGQAFFTENAAKLHAKTLKNKSVVLVQKSAETAAPVEDEKPEKTEQKPAKKASKPKSKAK